MVLQPFPLTQCCQGTVRVGHIVAYTAVQRQNAVSAHFTSKQKLYFAVAEQHRLYFCSDHSVTRVRDKEATPAANTGRSPDVDRLFSTNPSTIITI